jgi:hypothetical protein
VCPLQALKDLIPRWAAQEEGRISERNRVRDTRYMAVWSGRQSIDLTYQRLRIEAKWWGAKRASIKPGFFHTLMSYSSPVVEQSSEAG